MKKLVSIILAVMLALTVSVTVFATAEEATPDTPDFELQIKEAIVKKFFEGKDGFDVTTEDIYIFRSATLSDGGFYFSFWASGIATLDVFIEETIGDYYYYHNCGDEVYRYKDGEIIEIKDAYKVGLINDDILSELSTMEFGIEPINNVPNPTETLPVTQPQTVNTEATSATKVVSPSSAATIDTPVNVNSNGAVQTGQSNFAMLTLLIVMALAGAAAAFSKYAYRK